MEASAQQCVFFDTLNTKNGRRIGSITLNSEKTLNALSLEMTDLLTAQLTAWSTDNSIALIILQAAGEKAFCAGGDLQDLYQSMCVHHASAQRDDIRANQYAIDFFSREYRLDYLIHTYPKPILCWGHGIVMGGGMGLMAGASHRVVTEKSRLAMPEIGIGLFPDVGGSWFLNRMPGKSGLFLALTGASLNAADAKFTKLADYVIAQADKQRLIEQLLDQAWEQTQKENHQLLSTMLRRAESDTPPSYGPLRTHFDLINQLCYSEDLDKTYQAITTLKTTDPWLSKASISLKKGAPSSLKLSFALLHKTSRLSLADIFRIEYIAALHCAAQSDFREGIRALLIDKDQQPQWQHPNLSSVSSQWLEQFFLSPWSYADHPLASLGQ